MNVEAKFIDSPGWAVGTSISPEGHMVVTLHPDGDGRIELHLTPHKAHLLAIVLEANREQMKTA